MKPESTELAVRTDAATQHDLASLDELALTASSYEEILRSITNVVAPMLSASMCGIMLWESTSNTLQMLPGSFDADEHTTASYRVSVNNTRSNAARVFSTGRTFVSNYAHRNPAILQDYVDAFGIDQLLSLSLRVGDRRTGVVHFANRAHPFRDSDVTMAERLASRVAIAVEHVRRLELFRRKEALEGMLGSVAEKIASGLPAEVILPSALGKMLHITGARTILLSTDTVPILVRNGPVVPEIEHDFVAASRSQPRTPEERISHPERAGDPGSSALHVPVVVFEERAGTLSMLRMRAEPLSVDERSALARLASLAALALATERYQQERAAMARMLERERIAEELHDHVAQILFTSKMALESALAKPGRDEGHWRSVTRARDLLARGEEAIREVIAALSQSAAGTLADRLEHLILEIEEQFGIAVYLDLSRCRLPAAADDKRVADLAVKVCREALVNAAKHARPSRISVSVQVARSGRLLLTVHDDGIGMSEQSRANSHGHGLPALRRAVREHGGALRVSRGPLGGTRLTASLDL